ncbi:hypothetical protein AYI69_g6387 [Smittium culicis]|uniref:Uncharacterized protein n=1 Tax=Smittium culicis TaxID=133412 RepID=A0A1R1XZC5_9FUNG|nr:hypothetical protein AYI69_g6387 [Smittium culicis]
MSSETVTSEAFDNLNVGKTAEPSVEIDQNISASIPATILNVYPELESLIQSMSEDFYRTMLTDEDKKEAIYGCPKSSKVCYNPSPINEAAPGSVKKADSAFYAIQVALAHGKRPIDYFIHRMLQSNPKLTLDDPVVDVLNTIRCIMGNAASMAAQARLNTFHSGMSFTRKPEQVVESRGIHRFERYGLGYRHWPQELLWLMEKIRGFTPHQLQGAACSSICLAIERNCGPVSSDILRKYDHPSISKEIWWKYLTRTSQHSGTSVGALPEDE